MAAKDKAAAKAGSGLRPKAEIVDEFMTLATMGTKPEALKTLAWVLTRTDEAPSTIDDLFEEQPLAMVRREGGES